jgi:DNA-binding beta-propeller fold protein YncE
MPYSPAEAKIHSKTLPSREHRSATLRRRWLWALLGVLVFSTLGPIFHAFLLIKNYSVPGIRVVRYQDVMLQRSHPFPEGNGPGITVSDDGSILVSYPATNRVLLYPRAVLADGRVFASGDPLHDGESNLLALGPEGRVYVLHNRTGVIHVYDRAGHILHKAQLGSLGASVLAVDPAGNMYVSDTETEVIRKYSRELKSDSSWGDQTTPGVVRLGRVIGLVALEDRICASTAGKGLLVCVDQTGRVINRRLLPITPGPLSLGPAGNIYASDTSLNRIWILDRSGRPIARLVDSNGDELGFGPIQAIVTPADGLLYVQSDGYKVVIYRIMDHTEAL